MEDDINMDMILTFLREFGEVNGLLIIGIVLMFLWVRKLYVHIPKQHRDQVQSLMREIECLAAENRAYRERYLLPVEKLNDEVNKK